LHQAYLRVQLGIEALNDARHDEAADHFTAAVKPDVLSNLNKQVIYSEYQIFMIVRA